MERMIEALRILRQEYRFNGYIHAKAIPGADPLLIERLGLLADRLSVNIELPSETSLNRPRAGQGQGGDPAPDAPDRPAERGQPPGTGRLPACPRLCPGRAEHTR